MPRTTIIVTVIVIIASTGISMQDIITMNIENRVMKIELDYSEYANRSENTSGEIRSFSVIWI
jgi:hypothetical protein